MFVKFIAHAGMYVEEEGFSLLLDPWFFDSTPEHPIIQSIGGKFDTIDFQIPKTTERIETYAPDAILFSHFHPHHAPARDVQMLCKNSVDVGKKPVLMYATPTKETETSLHSHVSPHIQRHGMELEESVSIGPFTIVAKDHTEEFHRTWYVFSKTGSVLHIGDGRLNREKKIRGFDLAWEKLRGLKPSFLFLSAGGHAVRITKKDGARALHDACILTPVEAVKVAKIIDPRAVAPIGFYNHSIWKNRTEYIRPSTQIEEEFEWGASWLIPHIRQARLVPGYTLGIGEKHLKESCDLYLDS